MMSGHSSRNPSSREELHGDASDHGRVYQQGRGQQINVEQAYFGAKEGLFPWILDPRDLPRVRELDPLEIGVHRAPMEQGSAVPPYVSRDVDEELSNQLTRAARRGGFCLVIGDSTAGKTRTVYEAMLRILPDHRALVPDSGPDLRQSMLGLIGSKETCVIWLDDVERYLGTDGLTPGILGQLRAAGIVVLATLRAEQYRKLIQLDREETADLEHEHRLTVIDHVFNQVDPIVLPRRWNSAEIERAKLAQDPRLKNALEHSHTYGIAEYLAAGPILLREWRLAWEAGANPRGAALVSAAVDCARAGLSRALLATLLEQTHEHYLKAAGGVLLRPESLESAFMWATRRRYGVTSMLLPGGDPNTYRVFDYLPDEIARDPAAPPIHDEIWQAVLNYAQDVPRELFYVGLSAASQERDDIAESAWTQLADAGHIVAAANLARLFRKVNRLEEAESWYRTAAEAGYVKAAIGLGLLLEDQERLDEAESWYRRVADQDDHGAYHLALLLNRRGQAAEAKSLLKRLAENPGSEAAGSLGRLLAESGQMQEAETWLRRAIDEGDRYAVVSLGVLLLEAGRDTEAETWWLKAAESGVADAMANLGLLFRRRGNAAEAEVWGRRAVEAGMIDASVDLALLLAEIGRGEEAEELLREAASTGVSRGARSLAIFLMRSGRTSEAEPWVLKAIEEGETTGGSAVELARLLDDLGRSEEAERWWRQGADAGNLEAVDHLGWLYDRRGDRQAAEELFRANVESEDPRILCDLGSILAEREEIEEAIAWYQMAIDKGHVHAACLLGRFLEKHNRVSDAEKAFRAAFEEAIRMQQIH